MVKKLIFKGIHIWLYFFVPIMIIGISVGFTSFLLALETLILLMITCNRHSIGVFFILYGGSIGGIIRTMYPSIPIYGVLLVAIGFVLVWDLLLDFFKTQLSSLFWLGLLLVVFFIFFLMGPLDGFAGNKFLKMCAHASVTIVGYYVLNKSNKINADDLFGLLLLGAICMFMFVISYYEFVPGNLFDYDWFREQTLAWDTKHEETFLNYQHISMTVLYGIAIYLSQIRLKPLKTVFYLLCSAQLIFMSGCRQAMLGLFIVTFLRFVIFSFSKAIRKYKSTEEVGRRLLRKIISFVLRFIVAVYLIILLISLLSTDIDVINRTISEGDQARLYLFYEAWNIFYSNTLVGVGLGGFHFITGVVWPHNFFLELLCETGLIGTIVFTVMVIINIVSKRAGLFYLTKTNLFYFLIVSALFVRVMVSSDFSESIELFSAVFAIPVILKNPEQ